MYGAGCSFGQCIDTNLRTDTCLVTKENTELLKVIIVHVHVHIDYIAHTLWYILLRHCQLLFTFDVLMLLVCYTETNTNTHYAVFIACILYINHCLYAVHY